MNMTPIASACAAMALVSAQATQAQQSCVEAADLADMVTYAMPLAYDATLSSCGSTYAPDGFMLSQGDAYIDRFRAQQDQAWPGAFRMLQAFMADDKDEAEQDGPNINQMIANMPEESLRPFVDALVTQMIAGEIKPETCGTIERGLELLSPLPVENTSQLVAFIAELAEIKDPSICPVTSN